MFIIICNPFIMNDVELRVYLERIINSKTFAPSGVYKRLLEYLTEATLKGEKPKEFTIGSEVFSQEVDDPSTSRVRVAVYKLRKKLDKYYKEEGVDDQICFTIPKGGYSVKFIPNKNVAQKNWKKNKWVIIFGFAFLVLILFTVISFVFQLSHKSDYTKLRKTEFWNDLVDNKIKTVIVAGDFFLFTNRNLAGKDNVNYNIRDLNINSEQDLKDYVNETDSLSLEDFSIPKGSTYLQRDALFSMPFLIPVLDRNEVDYEIVLGSNFNWEIFNESNIIYVGVFKNMRSLSFLNQKLHIKYNTGEYSLDYQMSGEVHTFHPNSDATYYTDYVFVAKIPGPHNNVIYLFNSIYDIGCIEAVKYFTMLDSVKSFEKQTFTDASYFTALFKVEGIKRSAVSFNLVGYNSITDSTLNNFWLK